MVSLEDSRPGDAMLSSYTTAQFMPKAELRMDHSRRFSVSLVTGSYAYSWLGKQALAFILGSPGLGSSRMRGTFLTSLVVTRSAIVRTWWLDRFASTLLPRRHGLGI